MSSFPWPNPDHEEIRRLRVQNAALRATVERVEALLATHPSAVWVSELRAALSDPR